MLVVHNIEYLEVYMLTSLIIWLVILGLILLIVSVLSIYDWIYEYVCHELDKCSYFGED